MIGSEVEINQETAIKKLLKAHEQIGAIKQKNTDAAEMDQLESQLANITTKYEKLERRVGVVVAQMKSIWIDITALFHNKIYGFKHVDGALFMLRSAILPILGDLHIADKSIKQLPADQRTISSIAEETTNKIIME